MESPDRLKGRDEQLNDIRRASYAAGRHVFIHGYRGVGKTSLAQTAAYQVQSADEKPVVLGCSEGTTLNELIRDVLAEALADDPRVVKAVLDKSVSAGSYGLTGSLRHSLEMGDVPIPATLNEAVRMLAFFGAVHSKAPVIVVDEFDRVTDLEEQRRVADSLSKCRTNIYQCASSSVASGTV